MKQDNATLWRPYTMLTNVESVFRCLKTDLGFGPVFQQIDRRVEGHLFISVLAYPFMHMLRLQLKAKGSDDSWQTLRELLARQRRVTATLLRSDGRTAHVRKATRPEPQHQKINQILGHSPNPGGTHRVLVQRDFIDRPSAASHCTKSAAATASAHAQSGTHLHAIEVPQSGAHFHLPRP